MDKIKIPEITFNQFEKALSGELVELIPAKEGYNIYIYPDGKYYKYIKPGMIKLREIFVHNMRLETIKELQLWFPKRMSTKIIAKITIFRMSLN